jgi:NAD(P)H dehydrogenase (quinone)
MSESHKSHGLPVAIVGAAGQTGMAAVDALARRGIRTRALVHRPEQEEAVRAGGAAEAVVVDLDVPHSLQVAYEGARAVLHIPPVFDAREVERTRGSVEAARQAGIERFVLHSVLQSYTPGLRHHRRKADAEAELRLSGLRWTILQAAMYASTPLAFWSRSPAGEAVLPFSLDARFTPVALTDVAEATARVLAEDGHDFASYELCGPEVVTGREMLETMGAVTGEDRRIRRADLAELALPPQWDESQRADMAAMCAHYDKHGLCGGSRVLEWLLGRPATTFADALSR